MKQHVACTNDLVIIKDIEKQQNDIYSGNEENFVDAKSITKTENTDTVPDAKPVTNTIYYLSPG